jgi:peptidoglycan/LPS O-acetylase OafA/YrhL
VLFAIFSWHTIEKPVPKQRRRFSLTGARIAASDSKQH